MAPANVTTPSALARTADPGAVAKSVPRLPAHHRHGGGRKWSTIGPSTGATYVGRGYGRTGTAVAAERVASAGCGEAATAGAATVRATTRTTTGASTDDSGTSRCGQAAAPARRVGSGPWVRLVVDRLQAV